MLGEKHDLIHELPEHRQRIHELKMSDKHFSKLFDQYHEIDTQVRKIEEGFETPSDDFVEELKKQRLHMKDELLGMIMNVS